MCYALGKFIVHRDHSLSLELCGLTPTSLSQLIEIVRQAELQMADGF